jgi:hypothetical protein
LPTRFLVEAGRPWLARFTLTPKFMKDAKTAYQQTLEHKSAHIAQELDKIGQLICETAMDGETSLRLRGRLHGYIQQSLKDNGYQVKVGGTILSRHTTISWNLSEMP